MSPPPGSPEPFAGPAPSPASPQEGALFFSLLARCVFAGSPRAAMLGEQRHSSGQRTWNLSPGHWEDPASPCRPCLSLLWVPPARELSRGEAGPWWKPGEAESGPGQGTQHGRGEIRPRAKRKEGLVGRRGREMETPAERERQGFVSFLKETVSPCFPSGCKRWRALPRAFSQHMRAGVPGPHLPDVARAASDSL